MPVSAIHAPSLPHTTVAAPSATSPERPRRVRTVAVLGALAGCFFAMAGAWLGYGTAAGVLVCAPGLLLVALVSWLPLPIEMLLAMLAPGAGLDAVLILLGIGTLAFWGLLFGMAAVWLYRRSLRR